MLEKPRKYTDPELMMEDIEDAKLNEEMAPMRQSFEQRILSLEHSFLLSH